MRGTQKLSGVRDEKSIFDGQKRGGQDLADTGAEGRGASLYQDTVHEHGG